MSSSFWQDLESHMLLGYNASIVNLAELVQMFNLYCLSCRAMTSVNRYRENPSNDLMLFTSGTATSLCWHGQYSAGRCHQRCYMLASRWLILCKTPSSCPASISFYTPPMYSLDSSPCLLYDCRLSEFFDQRWNLIGQRHNTASAMKRSKYNMSNGFPLCLWSASCFATFFPIECHPCTAICWSITQQKAFILLYLPWMWTNRTQFQS